MKTFLGWLKPVVFVAVFLNLTATIISFYIVASHHNLPPLIPLWFSKSWGESRLANPSSLWILPFLILTLFFISTLLAKLLNKIYPTLAKILVWASAFISLVFLLALYKIVLVAL